MAKILLIGYGNELRGDDGLGPFVAESLAAANLPGVHVLSMVQLLPELAADLAAARLVVFVDALANPDVEDFILNRIAATMKSEWSAHHSDPRVLLALTHAVYGVTPEAWWAMVPGQEFPLHDGLSAYAHRNARKAIALILAFLRPRLLG